MDWTIASLIALGILALVVVAFFAVFRGKGKFLLKSKFGEASAMGENPTTLPSGVRIGKVEAGGSIHAHSSAAGGIDIGEAKARNVDVAHTPGQSPPKAQPPA